MAIGRSAQMVVCAELAHIKAELESLRDMNAKHAEKAHMESYDIRDFAEEMFGLKKSQAYSLARVGERFLSDDGSLKREYVETLGNVGASVLGLLVNTDDAAIVEMSEGLDGKLTAANIRAWNKALKEGKPSERSEKGVEATEKAVEAIEKPSKSEKATKASEATEKAVEAPEGDMTFNETEGVAQLHIVLEVRDGITEMLVGDGDAQRRRVYATNADADTILHDLAELLKA